MAIERMYRQAAEVNRDFGPIATLPPCFDYGVGGVWQGMSRHRFREFTNFSTAQERNHRVAEQLLSELDALLLSHCIKGCPQPCANEERDVAGVPVTPLFEQFYYHFQGQIVVIVDAWLRTAFDAIRQQQRVQLTQQLLSDSVVSVPSRRCRRASITALVASGKA